MTEGPNLASSYPNYGASLRGQLADTSDPRAVATRQRLFAALMEAVSSGATNLTVTEICKRARVGRSTFYAHFRTVEDLLVGSFADTFALGAEWDRANRHQQTRSPNEITRAGLAVTVQKLQELRPVISYATATGSRARLERSLVDAVALEMCPIIAEITGDSDQLTQLRSEFLAAGLVRVTLASLDAPTPDRASIESADVHRFVDEIVDLFPTWVVV